MHLPTAFAVGLVALIVGGLLFAVLIQTTRRLTTAEREARRFKREADIAVALRDNPSLGFVVADRHGVIVDCNETAERLLQTPREHMVGRRHTTDYYAPEELQDELAALYRESGAPAVGAPELLRLRLESGARAVEREMYWLKPDGARFAVNVMISPLADVHGALDGFLLTFRDIGVRRNAEQMARSRQRLIEQFVLHTPASISLLDRQLNYVAVSQRWVTDFKLGTQNLVGSPFLDQFSPMARRWRDVLERCLAGCEEGREEDTLQLPDGSEIVFAWRCRPWHDSDGSIGGLALYAETLAERRLIQRRLLDSENRLREAQSIARVGSWEFDLRSRRLAWSEEAYAIHELPVGLPITLEQTEKFFIGNSRELFQRSLQNALNQSRAWDFEADLETAKGQKLFVRCIGRIEMEGDRPHAIHCTVQDITDRKRIERELARAKDEALAQARLKADFLAAMSHEIRTPLNAITGMTSLLAHTKLDDEQREYVSTVRGACDSLLAIINDILDFSKIESGKLELENEPYSLLACVETALDFVAGRAQDKGLEVACWVDPLLPPWLLGDITRVRQVITNLVSNAVKFTPSGEVFVSCRALAGTDGRPCVRVTVRDTGIGIRGDVLPHLFHAYTQADATIARTHGGTGLGLAICRRLTELMEGRIWAESEPGRGSRFHFEIPLLPADMAAPELDYPADILRGRRFLVVDDHPSSQEVIQLHLEAWGALGVSATSPLSGLALLRSGEVFDGIIVDYDMPIMDGVTFARGLQDHPGCPPMVLLAPLGKKASALQEGIFEMVLTKPLKAYQLRAAISRIFVRRLDKSQKSANTVSGSAVDLQVSEPLRARVLIVDDNLINQSVARTLLEQVGATAAIAASGEAALRQLRRENFDFVLMDMQMPGLDGAETTRRIRKEIPVDVQPVVIALTAYATSENRDKCLNAGMDDFIAKPLDPVLLGTTVRRWIEARRAHNAHPI
ncbi:MAG: response regulator [Opitutaceae bacterium]|nr:response regulator [Opitutaceae bacterium]